MSELMTRLATDTCITEAAPVWVGEAAAWVAVVVALVDAMDPEAEVSKNSCGRYRTDEVAAASLELDEAADELEALADEDDAALD